MILDLRKFIERERPIWDELDKLLRKMENDPAAKLTLADAERTHYLFERTSSALVRIATFAAEPTLISFLQALVARAYSELNDNRVRARRFRLRTWLFTTFPRTFRRYQRYFWCFTAHAGRRFIRWSGDHVRCAGKIDLARRIPAPPREPSRPGSGR